MKRETIHIYTMTATTLLYFKHWIKCIYYTPYLIVIYFVVTHNVPLLIYFATELGADQNKTEFIF